MTWAETSHPRRLQFHTPMRKAHAVNLSIILPLPPSTNKLWAPVQTKTGAKLVKRTVYADWMKQAKREVAAQADGICIKGQFAVTILLPEGRYDGDNLIKPLLDACQAGGAIANDKHGRRWHIEIDDTRQGTALIELHALNAPGFRLAVPQPSLRAAPAGEQGNQAGKRQP